MKTLDDYIKTKKPWEVEGVEWREVKLGEVCQRRSENVIPAGENQIYIGLEHINSGEIKLNRWEYSNKVKSMKYKFYPDDILYGKLRPYLDKAVVSDKEGICSTDFIVIKPIRDKILPYYLVFFLHTNIFINYATSMMKGVHLPRVSWTIIKRFKIPIPFRNGKPDLETQKKIVEYIEANFSRIDKILEKKKKELEQLDELWESVLEQAFKPKEGEVWKEVRLGDVADHFMGGTPKTTVDEYWDGNIPWISAKEFSNNDVYITKPTRYITEKGLKKSNARIAPKDSILLVTTASVGNVAIAGIDLAINQQITAIVPKNDILFKYLYYYLLQNAKRLLLRGQTTFKHINQKMVKKLPILIPFRNNQPDLEKQKEIANYLDSVYEKIKTLKEKIQKQITLLEEMKESILDEVFNHDNSLQSYKY